MRKRIYIPTCLFLAATTAATVVADESKEKSALLETQAALIRAAAARDVEGVLSRFVDNVVLLSPNTPAVKGKDNLRPVITGNLSATGFSVRNHTVRAEVSGELAYTLVIFEVTATGPDGKTETETGHVIRIWKKQPDGAWKITVEIWNSDQPARASVQTEEKK